MLPDMEHFTVLRVVVPYCLEQYHSHNGYVLYKSEILLKHQVKATKVHAY